MKLEMVGPQTQSHLWMEVFFQCIWGDWNPWQNTIKTNHIQFRFLAIRTSFLYSWDRYVEMQNAERPSLPWMIIKLWFLLKVIFLRKKKKTRTWQGGLWGWCISAKNLRDGWPGRASTSAQSRSWSWLLREEEGGRSELEWNERKNVILWILWILNL